MKQDVLIIGAGLLGCFTARALAQYNLSVLVLEAEDDVCCGISKANTGIIYSGIDNKPETLKARMTVTSCQDYERLAKELDFSFRRTGSLMLSFGGQADQILKWKLERGTENGVRGARLLSKAEVLELEPAVSEAVSSGLYVPGTGTVDPWEVGIAAYENARANGIEFRFHERVVKIRREQDGFRVETEKEEYAAKVLVNCAGLSSDLIREMTETPLIRLFPTGADYLILDTTVGDRIHHVLFHETEEKGKGVTIVPTVSGNLLIGPTEREDLPDMATAAAGMEELFALCRKVVPDLPMDVIRSFGSSRPNPFYVREEEGILLPERKSISNFTILEEAGLLSFIGIKTPGLTCAEPLGRYAADKAVQYLGGASKREDFDPFRKGIRKTEGLSLEEREALIREEPEYGEIICRCRKITKGEVLEAVRRGAKTIKEVKFRAGTGMGRCQGSFCTEKIRKILEEALSSDPKAGRKLLKTEEGCPAEKRTDRSETIGGAKGDRVSESLRQENHDIVIIGGGAAGLAAAAEAAKYKKYRILLLERDANLGGILNQCVHEGFGVHQLGESLTGQEYAERYRQSLAGTEVEVKTGTTVLKIGPEKEVYAVNAKEGVLKIKAGAIILAMGCREVPAGALLLPGTRPEGVITAGRLQYMMNLEGIVPGKRAVILGSGDVGMIMARQMAQAGIEVLGVYEKEGEPGGLPQNRKDCLEAYKIPLYLKTTVTKIFGKEKLTGVAVALLDEEGRPVRDSEKEIPCDLLVIAAGLIPENELTKEAGIAIDPKTNGPVTDSAQMTLKEGVFASGNVWKVMSLVDAASLTGEAAARNAAEYLEKTGAGR